MAENKLTAEQIEKLKKMRSNGLKLMLIALLILVGLEFPGILLVTIVGLVIWGILKILRA